MRRLATAVCIALLGWSALASYSTRSWAQERDAPAKEQPVQIEVDAPVTIPTDGSAPGAVPPRERTADAELADDGGTSYFLSALFFGAAAAVIALFLVALVLLVVGVVLLAAVIAAVVAVSAAALTAGVASTSTFVGVTRRSFGAGFEALLAQVGAVALLPCGVAISWIAYEIAREELALDVSQNVCLVLGGVGGAAAGAVLGLLTARAVRLTTSWARTKLSPPTTTSPPAPVSQA